MQICIDFDGTCVTNEFPIVGQEIGASYVLTELVKEGHDLILFTMRSNKKTKNKSTDPTIESINGLFLDDAVDWFNKHNIPLYGINTNPNQKSWTKSPKAYGKLYIDDAALGVPLKTKFQNARKPFLDWEKAYFDLIQLGYIQIPTNEHFQIIRDLIKKDLQELK